jgi:hypothetical protein
MSFRRIGEAFHCQVDVFWGHVRPIGHTTQELCNWSSLGSKELPSRNFLVHVITWIVKVHFAIFIAVNRRRTWNTGSCFGTKNYILASISYTISGTILRTLQKDALCKLDIVLVSTKKRRYRVRYSVSTFDIEVLIQ